MKGSMKNNEVHQYETCTSMGRQHLNPDPEVPEENVLTPATLLNWAFALGYVNPEAR